MPRRGNRSTRQFLEWAEERETELNYCWNCDKEIVGNLFGWIGRREVFCSGTCRTDYKRDEIDESSSEGVA